MRESGSETPPQTCWDCMVRYDIRKRLDRWILLPVTLLAASLFLAVCGGNDDDTVSAPTIRDDSVSVFPTHDRPLPTDWGLGHVKAKLAMEDDCLRGLGHDLNEPNPSYLLVWPVGFELYQEGDSVSVRDRTGAVAASVGEEVRLSGRIIRSDSDHARQIEESVPAECVGPYYMVGDDVTVVGPDEPTELSVPNSDVVFRRRVTWQRSATVAVPAVGYTGPGEMVMEGDCLLMIWKRGDAEERHVISWPPGFHPHVEDGMIEVRNGGGRTVARVGDMLKMTLLAAGGGSGGRYIPECDARLHAPITIRNFDLPVMFPEHNEGVTSVSYIEGRLEMVNGCIYVRGRIAVWPSDYTMEETDGEVRVLDQDGKTVVQVGRYDMSERSVKLKGRGVHRDDDYGRQIDRMISVDCRWGDFWLVK